MSIAPASVLFRRSVGAQACFAPPELGYRTTKGYKLSPLRGEEPATKLLSEVDH
jgi:hypothetical protein